MDHSTNAPKLSTRDAYDAMLVMLKKYYDETRDKGVGVLIGELEIDDQNRTADPGAWGDWLEVVGVITSRR